MRDQTEPWSISVLSSDLRAAEIVLGRNPNCLGLPETMVRFVAAICLCLSCSVGWEVTHRWLTGGSWCRKVNVALCPSETACDPNSVSSLRAGSLHLARTSCCSGGTGFCSSGARDAGQNLSCTTHRRLTLWSVAVQQVTLDEVGRLEGT